jgi:Putative porin
MNKKAAASLSFGLAPLILLGVLAPEALAQAQKQAPITGDVLIRQEWNDGIFTKPDPVPSNRTRFQIRPRFEVETQILRMGLGADLNYSKDNNLEPKDVPLPLALIRDNYDARSIRLDLAYLGLNLSSAIKLDAGRMVMPFRLTDMIWDRDLRIQGGSAVWTLVPGKTGEAIARVSGLYSRGSHVFADSEDPKGSSLGKGVSLAGGSLDLGIGSAKRVDFSGSYLVFDHLENLERMIRRQNTRVNGELTREYQVIDLTLRLRTSKPFPMQVVLDGARNRKAPDQRNGVWAALVLGSLRDSRFRGEYTFAKVDRDVTVAAYAGDDFFWGTGWLGHRAEVAFAQSPKSSFHVIAQMQQFKDSANLLERTNWVKRLRLEARRTF